MKNLKNKLNELKERKFDVVLSRGSLALQQTQRNNAKAEILMAIYQDLKEELEENGEHNVYITSYGPVIEILNSHVEEQVYRMDKDNLCSGFISIQLDTVMKNLDVSAEIDEEDYFYNLEVKKQRQEENERKKKLKTQRDAESRAEKARQREEAIAKLQARKEESEE